MNGAYCGHRFLATILSCCAWLYYTFLLSFRDTKKTMLDQDVMGTYEVISQICSEIVSEWCRPGLNYTDGGITSE